MDFSQTQRQTSNIVQKLNASFTKLLSLVDSKKINLDETIPKADPFELLHEPEVYLKRGLELDLVNKIINNRLFWKTNLGEKSTIIILGDDGGYLQAVANAYNSVNYQCLYQFESDVNVNDIFKSQKLTNLSEDEVAEKLFNLNDLLSSEFNVSDFKYDVLTDLSDMMQETDHYGASLFIAAQTLPSPNKWWWDREILMKPYLVYFSILAFHTLELGGNFVIRIEDT